MRAMILAAGRGERMRPLTDHTPKPLLQVGGKPLIVWHIERLVAAGMTDLVINHAWLGQQIEHALGDGSRFGARITYSPEPRPLETAGGIAQALPFFGNKPFLVINGDIWCNWNPVQAQAIAANLAEQSKSAWLLLVDNPPHHPDGDFRLSTASGLVLAQDHEDGVPLTFAGVGIYQPELFKNLPAGQAAPLAPLLRQAISRQHIVGSHHQGSWVDVGTPERLTELDHKLSAT
ncbi:N-acetylmuramate alpha-1-phosphate uridylyltransferase MurU [Pollutimonas harenae]|uniref:Nucleotidyltransferase family protein n=1 Tax=Pollutimonas harenae TaxID=657015 RepID=A0A853GZY3_9BURK|nr:nucleotidyltransferase family protein [Pollutimonas harenae]NYT86286.1 nucleotidyltransferase family protein [Pollutimonas harenae]TEA69954.1 nucleotidyltransferase family protein [Pollutimonas harenae]